MLSAFAMAFRTPDLRRKIFFTLSIMALFRFGSVVPTPGVSYSNVQECLQTVQSGGLFGLINLFSGGALLQRRKRAPHGRSCKIVCQRGCDHAGTHH